MNLWQVLREVTDAAMQRLDMSGTHAGPTDRPC